MFNLLSSFFTASAALQIDESRMTNSMSQSGLRAQNRSGSSASNASDEDADDHKSGSLRTQSRIDKWKAKHEAMLKMASDSKKSKTSNGSAANVAAAAAAAAMADLHASSADTKSASSEDEAASCLQSLAKQLPLPPAAALSVK